MSAETPRERVARLLAAAPLVDGHNDLPIIIRRHTGHPADPAAYPLEENAPGHTDLARLRSGGVGAQFWAAYVPCDRAGPGAAAFALEQIDVVRRVEARLPEQLEPCWRARDVEAAFARGRLASLVGVEGGHAIEGSLGVLRTLRALGVRYLTLTHNCSHEWADSATDEARHGGLSAFGRDVVRELNRLGMLVDLSHASDDVMGDVLDITEAPIVFSHSSARALCDHPRNVPDDVLERVRDNGGVVMVTFVARFVSEACLRWWEARESDPHRGPGEGVGERPPAWARATIADVADHVEHVRDLAGVAHVGLGSDFDGTDLTPEGLEDVSGYPALLEVLAERGWSDEELTALAGGNVLRVMREAEIASERMQREGEGGG
ncbi:MAG: dipeptidase [Gemmatimonadota bacterium]|jgi:membrane dipeptidase